MILESIRSIFWGKNILWIIYTAEGPEEDMVKISIDPQYYNILSTCGNHINKQNHKLLIKTYYQ